MAAACAHGLRAALLLLGGQSLVDRASATVTAFGSFYSHFAPRCLVALLPLGRIANALSFALSFSQPSSASGRMDYILCNNESSGARFAACEFGVPLEHAAAAIAALVAWAEQGAAHRYLDWPVDIRFAESDHVWLSPCFDRRTCFIGACVRHTFSLPFSQVRMRNV